MQQVPGLFIMQSDEKGRGVYSAMPLEPGDLIEICPIIKIPTGQLQHLDKSILYDYYFLWEEKGFVGCIALGYGSIYNHSIHPNARIIFDYSDSTIKMECQTTIASGDEILIDYTGDGLRSESDLWFDPV